MHLLNAVYTTLLSLVQKLTKNEIIQKIHVKKLNKLGNCTVYIEICDINFQK